MRLGELVEVVAKETGDMPNNIFGQLAVIHGAQVPGNASPGWIWYEENRVAQLTPEFDADGRFMRLECFGHVPNVCLFESDSLEDLEREILEAHFNPFTSYTCAFIDGNLRRFDCYYRDRQGKEHLLDKRGQVDNDGFGGYYGKRRLRWLK